MVLFFYNNGSTSFHLTPSQDLRFLNTKNAYKNPNKNPRLPKNGSLWSSKGFLGSEMRKKTGKNWFLIKLSPWLFGGRENICQHSMILPTYPGKMGPQTSPQPPQKKTSFRNCWWNIRGTFAGGPVGEILETSSKDPIPNCHVTFEKILRFSGIFFAKSSLRKWKNVQQNPDMIFLYNLVMAYHDPLYNCLKNTYTPQNQHSTSVRTPGPKRKVISTNPSDSGESC